MLIFHTVHQLQNYLRHQKQKGLITGFVPTMGALHQGHLSLLEDSKKATDLTICSIFVNPTQFNDPKDFEKYPVTISIDVELLLKAGVDVLFLPSVKEIYPNGTVNQPHYDLGFLETVLEGKYRPGHFQGVCQVMHRLLTIADAHHLFMGQKDYQQCMVINHLIETQKIPTKLHIAPTLRESDGLAMSSRNMRLTKEDRQTAVAISQTLTQMKMQLQPGSLQKIKDDATAFLTSKGFRVDYTEIAHADTLALVNNWNGTDPVVALIAAYIGEIRLIDNMLLTKTD
ncbi:pantoate--beta-alanine ligase [Lacibacter sediminis]|uniref:Pantothenate synthetase n=1 Tax=Lacibacter sediminis TaxID=2760713 RepID=A0A7G5XBI4_9BACT|nr:pantoate--beta-alanine ligase [Lacibacter sediminis]QNA42837.1 pantoate--beta-alanine ligase [Lacibacter sediminis]